MVMLPVRWTEPVTLKICLSGTRESAYNGWIFRRKIYSLPRVIFNTKLCEPNGVQHPILRPRSVPYVHQQYRILYLQKSIRFCNFYYCEIADAGGWYTDKRSSEQNGYASRLFWSSRNVKNMSERNARKRIKWLNFHRKFIPCRELFLTKTASKWSVRSIPFCDAERSVYQPPASASLYLQKRILFCNFYILEIL